MVSRELIEHTRKLFPLSTEHVDTMIAGLSMGGYGHTYLETPGIHDWKFWDEYILKAIQWFVGE